MYIPFAFLAGFLLDVVWARCVNAISNRRAVSAANLSVLLYLCTIVSTVLIVEKCFLAIAAYAVGGWIGTYAIIKWGK
jgi:hypothetical protein